MTLDQYEEEMQRVNDEQYENLMLKADEAEEFNELMEQMNREIYEREKLMKQNQEPTEDVPKEDGVVNPSHYDLFPDTTVMDVLEKVLNTEELIGFWKGNAIKYRLRLGKKKGQSAVKDLQKAKYYEEMLFNFWTENQP